MGYVDATVGFVILIVAADPYAAAAGFDYALYFLFAVDKVATA